MESQNISAGWSLKHHLFNSIFYSHRKWGPERERGMNLTSIIQLFSGRAQTRSYVSWSQTQASSTQIVTATKTQHLFRVRAIAVCKCVRSTTIVCMCIYFIRTMLATIGNKLPNLSGLNNRSWFLPYVKTSQQLKFTQSDSVIFKPSLGFRSSSGKT